MIHKCRVAELAYFPSLIFVRLLSIARLFEDRCLPSGSGKSRESPPAVVYQLRSVSTASSDGLLIVTVFGVHETCVCAFGA